MKEGQKRKAVPRSGHREGHLPSGHSGAEGQGPEGVPTTAPAYSPLLKAAPPLLFVPPYLALYILLRFSEKTMDDVVCLRTVTLDLDFNISDPQPTETCGRWLSIPSLGSSFWNH